MLPLSPRNEASVSTIIEVAEFPNRLPRRLPPLSATLVAFEPPRRPARLPRAPRSRPPKADAIWLAPDWLEASGSWISILFLLALGVANVHAAVTAPADEVVAPVGLKGKLLGKLMGRLGKAGSPGLIALVGALFALSFDTVSQAALFSLTAQQFGGLGQALMLGALFTLGMLVTDGINGLWISRLIARADDLARVASRVMSLAVGGVSLLIASFALAKMTLPPVDDWAEGKELFFGGAVMIVVLVSYLIGKRLARIPAV